MPLASDATDVARPEIHHLCTERLIKLHGKVGSLSRLLPHPLKRVPEERHQTHQRPSVSVMIPKLGLGEESGCKNTQCPSSDPRVHWAATAAENQHLKHSMQLFRALKMCSISWRSDSVTVLANDSNPNAALSPNLFLVTEVAGHGFTKIYV